MNTTQPLTSIWLAKFTRRQIISTVSVTCLVGFFFAQSNSAMAREEHAAHAHGIATINLVVENNKLELELDSPAVNLVGFEHAPQNESQRDAVKSARAVLSSPDDVLVLQDAGCSPISFSVEVEGPVGEAQAKESDPHEDEHHDDEHDEDKHHKDEHDEDEHESHSEFVASYAFDCENGAELNSVGVKLFERFKGLEKINVNWVTDSAQGSTVLQADSADINLK